MNNRTSRNGVQIGALAVYFIVLAVLALIITIFLFFDFNATDKPSSVHYVIGDESYKLSGEDAYSDSGLLLVCFDDIAKLCGMTVAGTATEKTFYAGEIGQKISFSDGERTAKINDSEYEMSAVAVFRDERVFVPLCFIEENMVGVSATLEKNRLTIKRSEYNASTKDAPIFVEVTFAGGAEATVEAPEDTSKIAPEYDFVADLSAYEKYMCPEDPDAFLILVNRTNPIDEDYVPENLVPITNVRQDGREESMQETAEGALQALFIEMRAAGYTDVSVTSGYRSYSRQKYLYGVYTNNEMADHPDWSRERAEKEVDTYSARPGTSEHQTGLCCDMHNLGSASQRFANEEVYTWLINNCYKFGFILRFPEGKEEITGYSFEPWHFRFVGRYHASRMHEKDMCLEEYILYLEENE